MAQTIKLKRSAVSGNTPSTSDLELGEIAINTYDGKVFIKKNDGSASVVEVGAADNTKLPLTGGTITGTVIFNSAPTFNTAIAMGGSLNVATTIGIAGTTVIDSSRNLTNIGTITFIGDITQGNGDYIYNGGGNFDIKHTTAGQNIVFSTTPSGGSTTEVLRITPDGQLRKLTGDFTLDVAGNIHLDADGSFIFLKDGGSTFGQLKNESTDFSIKVIQQDKDLLFKGNDGGSEITALKLDMSDGGAAFFLDDIRLYDTKSIRLGTDQDFRISFDGSTANIQNSTQDSDILIKGNDGGSTITALSFDMSNAGKATFTFDGKKFTTKLKTDKKKTSPSLPKMVTLRSGKKGTIAQRLKEIDREKAANKRLSLVRSSIRAKK